MKVSTNDKQSTMNNAKNKSRFPHRLLLLAALFILSWPSVSAQATFSVNWMNGGSLYASEPSVVENTNPTLPSPVPSGPSATRRFVGWTANGSYQSDAAPSDLFMTTTDPMYPVITANSTFYAVYADYEGGSYSNYSVQRCFWTIIARIEPISGVYGGSVTVTAAP